MAALTSLFTAAVATVCGPSEPDTDFYGGDLQPLGAGFRNASSVGACCTACQQTNECNYFSYSPKHGPEKGPAHNCWLKATLEKRQHNADRQSASRTNTPAPPPPSPCFNLSIADHPWCDATLSPSARAAAAVSAMTLDEKCEQLSTFTPKTCPGVKRLDWPEYGYHSEGLHGLRTTMEAAGLPATVFPQTTAMAATGNLSLIREMGRVMAREARAVNAEMLRTGRGPVGKGGSLFFWSPTLNLGRDPRWGRFQESISEDPWLLGAYSATFLQAFQAADAKGFPATIASCKHIAAYSVEGGAANTSATRHTFDANVSAQDLSESYLPAFQMCVTQGRPGQVMCRCARGTPGPKPLPRRALD